MFLEMVKAIDEKVIPPVVANWLP